MAGKFHPNASDITPVPASEDRPRRISIGGGKAKVYFGPSVADSYKEVELDAGDNKSDNFIDVAQPVWLVTTANTVVVEGLAPIKAEDGVLEENFDTSVKVVKPKEAAKKDQQKVAESNESQSIPSLTGEEEPAPEQPAAVKS